MSNINKRSAKRDKDDVFVVDFNAKYSALLLAGKALHLAGDKKRYAQRRELLSLQAKHIPVSKNLKQQININNMEQDEASSCFDHDLNVYKEAVRDVFGDDEVVATSSDRSWTLQAKLCQVLHRHEIQVKQIHFLKQHHKQHLVNSLLKKELKELEQRKPETELRSEIERVQTQTQRLREESERRLTEQQEEIEALRRFIEERNLLTPQVSTAGSFDGSASSSGFYNNNNNSTTDMDIGTPKILQQSKIWVNLKQAEEKDADALWEVWKSATMSLSLHGGGSNHFGRNSSSHHKSSPPTGRISMPLPGSSSHNSVDGGGGGRQSIFGAILGGMLWEDDNDDDNDDGLACESPPSNRFKPKSVAEFLTGEDNSEPLSPTSAAIRELADEVFSF
jgi:hypothetical protein